MSFSLTKVRAVTLVQNLKTIAERSSDEAIDSDEVIVLQVLFIATVHAHNKPRTLRFAFVYSIYQKSGFAGAGIENGEITSARCDIT